MEEHANTALMDSVHDYVHQEVYGRTSNVALAENIATRVRKRMDTQARPVVRPANGRVEIVAGYDADGHEHLRVLVDGQMVDVEWFTIDPDSTTLRRDEEAWVQRWEHRMQDASPLAREVALEWVTDTARRGHIQIGDDEDE